MSTLTIIEMFPAIIYGSMSIDMLPQKGRDAANKAQQYALTVALTRLAYDTYEADNFIFEDLDAHWYLVKSPAVNVDDIPRISSIVASPGAVVLLPAKRRNESRFDQPGYCYVRKDSKEAFLARIKATQNYLRNHPKLLEEYDRFFDSDYKAVLTGPVAEALAGTASPVEDNASEAAE